MGLAKISAPRDSRGEMSSPPLVLLGCGYTLTRLALARPKDSRTLAVTGNPERRARLQAHGVSVVTEAEALAHGEGAHVVVSLPPEAGRDVQVAQALASLRPARLVYLSSTGVYGTRSGEVDEQTPVEPEAPQAIGRLAAEALYRPLGGVVLRVAGIYGPGRGLHQRLQAGTFRLPGEGSRRTSRIHVDDLVSAIEVALARAAPGSVLCVADAAPVPLREVVEWLCVRLSLPPPPSIPLEAAPPTLRGDRAVRARALEALGWQPAFPTWREGFEAVFAEEAVV